MQSKNIFKFLILILFFSCFNSVNAIEIVPAKPDSTNVVEVVDSLPAMFKSYAQFAFGFSQRTDESQLINHSMMIHAKLYYHLSNKIATKFGVGFSSPNMFKSINFNTIGYRNLKLELGFRWNLFDRGFTLYHENGFEYNYYYEPQSRISEQRIGMNFKFGIHFRVNDFFIVDIGIEQTFNDDSFSATKNINPSLSPVGLKDDRFFNEVFNPLAIQILLFKKL